MNTTENNKLLAEFLGFKKLSNHFYNPQDILYSIEQNTEWFSEDLKFHKDYNWLMLVVEKITFISMEDDNFGYNYIYIGYDFEDKKHYVNLFVSQDNQLNGESKTSKIEALYLTCVEFVKWYNEKK